MSRALWGFLVLLPTVALGAASLLDSYMDVQWESYTHAAPDFSLQYPYKLRAGSPSRPGEVFNAAGPERIPSLNVMVLPRPPGLDLAQAAQAAAKQFAPNGAVVAHQSLDLGGVTGELTTVEWSMPIGLGVELRSMQVSAFQGENWVIVTATDGRAGEALGPDLVQAVKSVRFAQ